MDAHPDLGHRLNQLSSLGIAVPEGHVGSMLKAPAVVGSSYWGLLSLRQCLILYLTSGCIALTSVLESG